MRESIIQLYEGQPAPEGYEVLRILQVNALWLGGNSYTVVAACPAPEEDEEP